MLKRTIIYILVLTSLALLAMAPLNLTSATENTHKAQTTVEVTVIVPGPTLLAPSAPATGEISQSTLIIIGFLVIILIVIVIGGAILASNRREA